MPHAASGSPSSLWWAADVGPCRVVTLCSYCSTAAGSLQLAWLERELAAVDRRRTPWLVVMMHAARAARRARRGGVVACGCAPVFVKARVKVK